MANIVGTDFDYTYPGELATEIFYLAAVKSPEFMRMFRVKENVRSKAQINLIDPLNKILKAYTTCGNASAATGANINNTTLETSQLEFFVEWCKDPFEETIMEEILKTGVDSFNPEGTEVETIINNLITGSLKRDYFRLFSFGDTNSGNADWNQLDGLWTQLIAGLPYCTTRVGTAMGTGALPADNALFRLKDIYTSAPVELRGYEMNMRKFFVTQSVFDNLLFSYISNTSGSDLQFKLLQDGTQSISFLGIDVVPFIQWDKDLADADNPLNATTRHLILYTVPDNHIVGVEKAADQGKFEAWFEKKDQKYYVRGNSKMGYVTIDCNLNVISY